jgi:hypothetical protein
MYELLMNTVRTFFGAGLWRQALQVAVVGIGTRVSIQP